MALDFSIFCQSTLTGSVLPSCFGGKGDTTYLDWILSSWGWTGAVSVSGLVIAMVMGILIGTLRTLPAERNSLKLLVIFGQVWVELFRNIPLLVQVFLWYHVLPALFPILRSLPPYALVSFALGFFSSARVAEAVRSGIQALPRGQYHAGRALGFNLFQIYRIVLLPVALRNVMPALTSESMNIIKNSSIAFAVSIAELTMFAMQAQEETGKGIEIYLAVTALYILSALLVNRIMVFIEKRTHIHGFMISPAGAES